MDRYFLVYPKSDDGQQLTWCLITPDEERSVTSGDMATFTQVAGITPVVALIPGRWINLFSVELPDTRAVMLKKALPFLLEEQLAQDPEDAHIVLPTHYKAGEITPVAVMDKTKMQTLFSTFEKQKINITDAMPDWLGLPLFDNTWTILLGDTHAWVRQNHIVGFCVPKDALMQMLQIALTHTVVRPEALHVYHLASEAADMEEQLNALHLPMAYEAVPEELLLLWAEHITLPPAINLLQNEFVVKMKITPVMRKWMLAGGLLLGIIAVQLVASFSHYYVLNKHYNTVHAQALAVYQQAFPDETDTVNARAQLEQALGNAGVLVDNPLFKYLQAISEPILSIPQVSVEEINFQQRDMRVNIAVPDFASLTHLENALTAKGLTVVQDSASLEENRVIAQLHISLGTQ